MKKLNIVLFLCLLVGGVIGYAASPAVFSGAFPSQKIVHFQELDHLHPALSVPNFLKVLTYNIGYASGEKNNLPVRLTESEVKSNLDRIAQEIKKLNVDIVCLQEVDFDSARTHRINQFEYLAKAIGMPYGAYAITWNKRYLPWPYWPPRIHYGRMVSGQAVLSRYPIEHQMVLEFSKPAEHPFWYNWFYLDRVAQKVSIRVAYQSINVWNVHLEAFHPKTRESQGVLLAEWIGLEPNPYKLVLGDFNSVSKIKQNLSEQEKKEIEDKGEALQKFQNLTGLKNAEANVEFFSMPSWNPYKKIDHIFYKPDSWVELATGNVEKVTASDHLPVWSILKMQK